MYKSQGLPLNFIVLGALALLVLVVAVAFFIASGATFGDKDWDYHVWDCDVIYGFKSGCGACDRAREILDCFDYKVCYLDVRLSYYRDFLAEKNVRAVPFLMCPMDTNTFIVGEFNRETFKNFMTENCPVLRDLPTCDEVCPE